MFTLMVEKQFSSAHQLRGYRGKCENLHGHTWKVQVVVQADKLNEIDIALDFTELKRLAGEVVDPLDHTCLNDHPPFDKINPSSENLARWIFGVLKPRLADYPVTLSAVTVWESPTASATYTEA